MPFKDRTKRNEYLRQWRKDNPESHWNSWLKHSYGMTWSEFQAISRQQSGVCAISGLPPKAPRKRLSVDHSHLSGQNRGLLNQDINFAIGLFQENPEWLRKAADYIEYWRGRESRTTPGVVPDAFAGQELPVSGQYSNPD